MHGALHQVGCIETLVINLRGVIGDTVTKDNVPIFQDQQKFRSLIITRDYEISWDRDRRRIFMRWIPLTFKYRYPSPNIEGDVGEAWLFTTLEGLKILKVSAPAALIDILQPEIVEDDNRKIIKTVPVKP